MLSRNFLQAIAKDLELPPSVVSGDKTNLIKNITKCFKTYEVYKKNYHDKYPRIKQIGNIGKEGITYEVDKYAVKTFKKHKSKAKIMLEATLQADAAKHGVAPRVIDLDLIGNSIIMDRLDRHLIEQMQRDGNILRDKYQVQLLNIFKKLDDARVFHGDSNILNYMMQGDKVFIIDFGMSKRIDGRLELKLGTSQPNSDLMLLGFILKMKELGFSKQSYARLLKDVPEKTRANFGL